MPTQLEHPIKLGSANLTSPIQAACDRIPPLWPLQRFVAVNPFLGLRNRPFLEVAQLLQQVAHGEILMPADYYKNALVTGKISERAVQSALHLARTTLPPEWTDGLPFDDGRALAQALAEPLVPDRPERCLTFAEFVDAAQGTEWAAFILEEISKWCSVYYDEGQSLWRMPWQGQGLLSAWRAAAIRDANPGLMGLPRFSQLVTRLPAQAELVTRLALEQLAVPEPQWTRFLHRQLLSVAGWSSHVQWRDRESRGDGPGGAAMPELLAIRLVYDVALYDHLAGRSQLETAWHTHLSGQPSTLDQPAGSLVARYVAQLALECAGQQQLIAGLTRPGPIPGTPKRATPPQVQAVFCIDVRSEIFRRALEAQSDRIETLGFAGFFGMACRHVPFGESSGTAQCPVLLSPAFAVRETVTASQTSSARQQLEQWQFRETMASAWQDFKGSAISSFAFVETAGLWSGFKLLQSAAGVAVGTPKKAAPDRLDLAIELSLKQQITLAAATLRNLGLTANFARWVLFCGHGSQTTNNPYGSALDCGACGGQAGGVNARVAAAILNDPVVRTGLAAQGLVIPACTVFLAGQHDTTTDEVQLYASEAMNSRSPEELKELQTWLKAAGSVARRERAGTLGISEAAGQPLDRLIFRRSRDWSQVRPEWGLAGNHAFIAAPRARTRRLNLGGRVFLHNYTASHDPQQSVLELILLAPMVVASWINLQYFASTVDNRRFGSGNKTIHNVVGTIGVWQGNGGDLQTGLPWQSVHDGEKLRHEPVRLSVFIETARANLERVLQNQSAVRELVDHGWVHLFALDPDDGHCWRCLKSGSWEREAS